jgi:hypothetical protein
MKQIFTLMLLALLFTSCSKKKEPAEVKPENPFAFKAYKAKYPNPLDSTETLYSLLLFITKTRLLNTVSFKEDISWIKMSEQGTYTVDKNKAKLVFEEWNAEADLTDETLILKHPDGERIYQEVESNIIPNEIVSGDR